MTLDCGPSITSAAHLEAAIRRQTVHEDGARRRGAIIESSTVKPSNDRRRSLPSRSPGPSKPKCRYGRRQHRHGIDRPSDLDDRARAEQRDPLEFGRRRVETRRTAETHMHAEHDRRFGERTGHVVVVADIGHRRPARSPNSSSIVSTSASACSGCDASLSMLTTGTVAARQPLDDGVVEDPSRDQAVIAGHDLGDVFDRLAGVEADLLASGVDRMTAELHDGHLRRMTGAVRRLLEDQRRALAFERATEIARSGESPGSSTESQFIDRQVR